MNNNKKLLKLAFPFPLSKLLFFLISTHIQSTSTLSDCPLPPDEFNVDYSGVEDDDDDDAADDDDDDDGGSAAVFGALASTLLPALLATMV